MITRDLTEKDFPLLTGTGTAKGERAYAYRFLQRWGKETRVQEKYTTNFPTAANAVKDLKARGVTVLTYSIFV